MQKVELSIVALANSDSQPNSFVVVLKEEETNRRLPVIIGGFEAQAIAIAVEGIKASRPLTHDLFKNTLIALDADLKEIVISNLKDGIFYATMVCEKSDGEILEIDSRTSDAIALAVRFGCPIFAYDFVLDEAGITLEDYQSATSPSSVSPSKDVPLSRKTEEELEEMLEEALKEEDYERAAEIRDELNKRKQS